MTIRFIALITLVLFLPFCGKEDIRDLPDLSRQQLLPDPGVVSYTFRNQFQQDVPGTLDMISEMGITNIEFSNLFGKTAAEIRRLLDERELICTSFGVGYNTLLNDMDQVVKDAHILGARHVRVAWIPHEAPFDLEDARKAVADFNRFGRTLKKNGLLFSYHNHGYEFAEHADGTLFDYIVQNTDPEYVNFQLDTYWVAWPGHDPVTLLKKYPDRFRLAHLKDLKKGATGDLTGRAPSGMDVPLGTGQIDFPALLKAAGNSNIEYFYIEDETDEVIERVPRSLEYITGITR